MAVPRATAAAAIAAVCGTLVLFPPGGPPSRPLRYLAAARGRWIGTAVRPEDLAVDTRYGLTAAREFNMVTPENAMKFAETEPAPGRFDFRRGDEVVAFAKAHGMVVRGHTLVWGKDLPAWLLDGHYDADQLLNILHDHITTEVAHFRGQVVSWDVVNEALDDQGNLKRTFWLRGIGSSYIGLAFQWAHEADPAALLYYNDGGAEALGQKSQAVYALIGRLRRQGVPVGGVGLQTHVLTALPPDTRAMAANMRRLVALGLQVEVTELDAAIAGTPTGAELAEQARLYFSVVRACVTTHGCAGVVMWGFTDRYSWIPRSYPYPGMGSADIYNADFSPKPARAAVARALAG
jgi:endo-1,4-beta-xylanase